MGSPQVRGALFLAILAAGWPAHGSAAQADGGRPAAEAALLQAARLLRQGREAEVKQEIERVAQSKEQQAQSSLLGAAGEADGLNEETLLWAVRAARHPTKAREAIEGALREFLLARAAVAAWLSLELDPRADDAEAIRLALARALLFLGKREMALGHARRLTHVKWNPDVQRFAIAMARRIELELKNPNEATAAGRARQQAISQARIKRQLHQAREQWLRKQGKLPKTSTAPVEPSVPEDVPPPSRQPQTVKEAIKLLHSASHEDWQRAQRALLRFGPAAVSELLGAARDDSRKVRDGANHVLTLLSGPEYARALLAASEDLSTTERAFRYMERLKTDGEAAPLVAAALEPERAFRHRQELIGALSELECPAAGEGLLRLSRDDNARVRRVALYRMWRVPGDAVTRRLIEAIGDADGRVIQTAIDALGKRKAREAVPALCKFVARQRKDELTIEAARALAGIGDPVAIPVLIDALETQEADFIAPDEAQRRALLHEFRPATARALKQLTGEDLGPDPAAWRRWLERQKPEAKP